MFYEFLFFVVWCHILISHSLPLYILLCLCEGWTILYQFIHVFYPWDRRSSSLHIEFYILVHTFYEVSISQKQSYSFTVYVVCHLFHCDCIFWGVYPSMVVWDSVKFYFSVGSIGKNLGAFLNVVIWVTLLFLYLMLYLCVLVLSIIVTVLGVIPIPVISWGCAYVMSSLIVLIFVFDVFPVSWCNCWNFTWYYYLFIFMGSPIRVTLGMPYHLAP